MILTACARPPVRVAADPPPRPDLAIVTWNMDAGAGDLPRLASALIAGALTDGRPPSASVLMLQEASPATRLAGFHAVFAAARTVEGVPRGNAILSSVPLENARAIELPRGRQRRIAATASIRVGGAELLLVNVHLENRASWWRGALPGDRIRERQMDALLARLPDGPGVLAGDLNVWLGTRERAYLAAASRFPDALAAAPHPTFADRLVLDHLLLRLPAGWRGQATRVPLRYGSDHHPVLGVIEDARRHFAGADPGATTTGPAPDPSR